LPPVIGGDAANIVRVLRQLEVIVKRQAPCFHNTFSFTTWNSESVIKIY
jgi:hypothetical protein